MLRILNDGNYKFLDDDDYVYNLGWLGIRNHLMSSHHEHHFLSTPLYLDVYGSVESSLKAVPTGDALPAAANAAAAGGGAVFPPLKISLTNNSSSTMISPPTSQMNLVTFISELNAGKSLILFLMHVPYASELF